jgi:putative tryptophan/tyrosine transport system substrate-binding protein
MRFFALGLALALAVSITPAAAQQKVHRVGVLNFGFAAPHFIATPINDRIGERLAELGFKEGRNLVLERRWADAKFEHVGPLTAELAAAKVDVIVTIGNGIAKIVTEANPRVPMVSLSCDSFASVANYARPSGNFTGVTCMSTELSPKRLEVAKQMFPDATRFVFLYNPNQGATGLDLTQKAAPQLGVAIRPVEMRTPKDLDKALAAIAAERPDVLLIYPDAVTMSARKEIADFALAQKLPSITAYKEYAEAGGLLSYGSTLVELGDRAGELIAKILRGAKPNELPIQQASRVYLTINLKAARALGHPISPAMLQRADYIIDDH